MTVRVLTINWGSSSLKCALVDSATGRRLREAGWRGEAPPDELAARIRGELLASLAAEEQPEAVAHRIVHGGASFRAPVLIDDGVRQRLQAVADLAPLHNPPALALVDALRAALPSLPHVAAFDTAFHASLPARARTYALPPDIRERLDIQRYGFHGLNHAHVTSAVARHLRTTPDRLRIISCHLGNGASVAAVEQGTCTETSMGMTPLEGLVMGTRAGDLDPGVLLALLRSGMDVDGLDDLLHRRSGLQGLTGTHDLRDIEARAAAGDEACRSALAVYGHRVRKYIGAYTAVMGGVDVVAFTGGIGQNSPSMRNRCLQRMDFLGAVLDEERNRAARVTVADPVADISDEASRTRLLVVAADEEGELAREAATVLAKGEPALVRDPLRVPVAVSARHAHLCQATLDRLFGAGYVLRERVPLAQPGQFAAEETISLVGPRGRIDGVRLIGPPREADQVEISRTDEFVLGVDAPVRLSGDLTGSPGIVVEGPRGRIQLDSGLICARRHVHYNAEEARRHGLRDGQRVSVRLGQAGSQVTFQGVVLRVSPRFSTQLHLDTDEANAAGVKSGDEAELLLEDPPHT